MIFRFLFLFNVLVLFLVSCNGKHSENEYNNARQVNPDSVLRMNQQLLRSEDQEIEDFCRRYQWVMKKTGTGLRYLFINHGNGKIVKAGSVVDIYYSLSLLNGDLIFRSPQDSAITITIGRREITSGLDEGISLMRTGNRCKFIVPSYLGYGLTGGFKKVPGNATLVYDVRLLKIRESQK